MLPYFLEYTLVLGSCGVPYLLDISESGKEIEGEVWNVDEETLKGLDDYEGTTKGYYTRKEIPVLINSCVVSAFVYFKTTQLTEKEKELIKENILSSYTLDMHKKYYRPIQHIQIKQRQYLGIEYHTPH